MAPGDDIITIDTGYVKPDFCAAYLIVERGRAAFVDCGTNRSVDNMLGALRANGLTPDAVDWLILTHVHLDHAGGAGKLIGELPNARLLVHPRGAPHMIDPGRLIAGARAVYGDEEFERHHGDLVPIPASRVVVAEDGYVAELAGRPLRCADTPGHARHHMSLWDARTRSWIAGDSFGVSYRALDTRRGPFIIPTTSPVQFEPEPAKASIRRMLAEQPDLIRIAHYGPLSGVQRLGSDLIEVLDAMVAAAADTAEADDPHAALCEALTRLYVARAEAHGVAGAAGLVPEALKMDIELNAQGLGIWRQRNR